MIIPISPVQTGTWTQNEEDRKLGVLVAGQSDYKIIEQLPDSELTTTSKEGDTYKYLAL